jgi:hypothetical protein
MDVIDDLSLWHLKTRNPEADLAQGLIAVNGGRLGIFPKPQKFFWPFMPEVAANSVGAIDISSSTH